MFIDCLLKWAMWPMGLLFPKFWSWSFCHYLIERQALMRKTHKRIVKEQVDRYTHQALKVDCIAVLASRTSTSSMFCDYSTCLHCYLKFFPTLHGWEYCRYGVKPKTIKRISTRNILISKPAKNISVLDMKDVFLSKCYLWSKNTFCML